MNRYKFLYVEDSESDIETFEDSITRINQQKDINIELDIAKTYDDAMSKINCDYDGIIIDMKLDDGKNGDEVILEFKKVLRCPTVIYTGTPDSKFQEFEAIKVFTKGNSDIDEVIDEIISQINTGIFNIIGNKGKIEKYLTDFFWDKLYLELEIWKEISENLESSEEIAFRYTLTHLQDKIDLDIPYYDLHEMYMHNTDERFLTGSILRRNNKDYIILTPPCDMVIRNDITESIVVNLCEIIKLEDEPSIENKTKSKSREKEIEKIVKNTKKENYHWLPVNQDFEGGLIDFRLISSIKYNELIELYENYEIRVQPYFIKEILRRFSSYYSRQGQPDFKFDEIAEKLNEKLD